MRGKDFDIQAVGYVEVVTVGGINPGVLPDDNTVKHQLARLNKCLDSHPKGVIIGKDIALGRYRMGEHEIVMQKTSYHVGFPRKPAWMEEKNYAQKQDFAQ